MEKGTNGLRIGCLSFNYRYSVQEPVGNSLSVFSETIRCDPGQYIKSDIIDKVLLRDF